MALSKRGKLKQQQLLLVLLLLLNFWTGNGAATSVRFHTQGDHRMGVSAGGGPTSRGSCGTDMWQET